MRASGLSPALGTRLTGNGVVVAHDLTRYGLHRMTVECSGKYPDLEAWLAMLEPTATPLLHDYGEHGEGNRVTCWLKLYWKE